MIRAQRFQRWESGKRNGSPVGTTEFRNRLVSPGNEVQQPAPKGQKNDVPNHLRLSFGRDLWQCEMDLPTKGF